LGRRQSVDKSLPESAVATVPPPGRRKPRWKRYRSRNLPQRASVDALERKSDQTCVSVDELGSQSRVAGYAAVAAGIRIPFSRAVSDSIQWGRLTDLLAQRIIGLACAELARVFFGACRNRRRTCLRMQRLVTALPGFFVLLQFWCRARGYGPRFNYPTVIHLHPRGLKNCNIATARFSSFVNEASTPAAGRI